MKNGMGVMVPGTGRPGLYIAAAVGALGGDPEKAFRFSTVSGRHYRSRQTDGRYRPRNGRIAREVPNVLYSEALVKGKEHTVKACIADSHTNVVRIEKDGEVIFNAEQEEDNSLEEKNAFLNGLSVKEVIEFAENVPLEQVDFMKQAEALNDALSKEGLTGKYGLAIGCALQRKQEKGLVGKD